MNYTPFMSVFDVDPPIIDNKHLIKWLKINFSFLRNKLLKIIIKFNLLRTMRSIEVGIE